MSKPSSWPVLHIGRGEHRCSRRGTTNRRHVEKREIGGYVYTYHATKGWRRNRL